MRLRTPEDAFTYAQAEGVRLRLDATDVQVRRPAAGRGGRRAFVSGEKKQNTIKAAVIARHHNGSPSNFGAPELETLAASYGHALT